MKLLAIITEGMAKMTMNDVISCAQQNSGRRFNDMPGARSLKMVTISSIAPTSADISVKFTSCAHTSMRLPGENSGPASGG